MAQRGAASASLRIHWLSGKLSPVLLPALVGAVEPHCPRQAQARLASLRAQSPRLRGGGAAGGWSRWCVSPPGMDPSRFAVWGTVTAGEEERAGCGSWCRPRELWARRSVRLLLSVAAAARKAGCWTWRRTSSCLLLLRGFCRCQRWFWRPRQNMQIGDVLGLHADRKLKWEPLLSDRDPSPNRACVRGWKAPASSHSCEGSRG